MSQSDFGNRLRQRLIKIYGSEPLADSVYVDLFDAINDCKQNREKAATQWSEKDIILITYGDSIKKEGEVPLVTLKLFLDRYLKDSLTYVHVLPFSPYSSDDGFSVIDYYQVNPELGTWDNIKSLGENYDLMADLVINHISQESEWFQNYIKGKQPGEDYFIEVEPDVDVSMVVRPRSLPLLTPVETAEGTRYVWTTFSSDQIDLNFANPQVLLEMMKVYLFYLRQGAQIIRLDAIAFLWKEIGTTCLHLRQTHEVVKLMRDIIDYIDPGIILITETNVPNKENLSYFGEGDEANMVYQFSLPPLLLHALYSGDTKYLAKWASSLTDIPEGCTFFNFTASHDGIGVRPLEGLIPGEEVTELTKAMKKFGGRISTKRNADGTDSPYEMNITYLDALKYTRKGKDEQQVARFICSQTIMMSFKGIPAFYIHSLLGTHNYTEGVKKTKMNRTINRKKWDADELTSLLETNSENRYILQKLIELIAIRKEIQAFHPNSPQRVYSDTGQFFVMSRGKTHEVLVVANFGTESATFKMDQLARQDNYQDIISGVEIDNMEPEFSPYQVMWIQRKQG